MALSSARMALPWKSLTYLEGSSTVQGTVVGGAVSGIMGPWADGLTACHPRAGLLVPCREKEDLATILCPGMGSPDSGKPSGKSLSKPCEILGREAAHEEQC